MVSRLNGRNGGELWIGILGFAIGDSDVVIPRVARNLQFLEFCF